MSITTMYSSPGTGKLFVVISLFFPAKVTQQQWKVSSAGRNENNNKCRQQKPQWTENA